MRQILFRGKTANVNGLENHNSYWVYGLLVNSGIEEYPYKIDGCYIIPETVGQFTGLTDKNGDMIFEGDIIQDKYDKSCRHIIKWFKEECCFGVLHIGMNGYLTPSSRLSKDWINRFDKIVIGNIHDNPELLK